MPFQTNIYFVRFSFFYFLFVDIRVGPNDVYHPVRHCRKDSIYLAKFTKQAERYNVCIQCVLRVVESLLTVFAQMPNTREDSVYLAKFAEQAERCEGTFSHGLPSYLLQPIDCSSQRWLKI